MINLLSHLGRLSLNSHTKGHNKQNKLCDTGPVELTNNLLSHKIFDKQSSNVQVLLG